MKRLFQNRFFQNRFFKNTDGAVAIYAAFVSALIMGAGVLALDFGKAALLKSQMQNAADSAALSAAMQLDGQVGAVERATAVAEDALNLGSSISDQGDKFSLAWTPRFYSTYDPDTDSGTLTTSSADALYVEIVMSMEDVTIIMEPILAMISTVSNNIDTFQVNARAVATPSHIICDPSPFFICNPNEPDAPTANSDYDLLESSNKNAGRQIKIKGGAGAGASFAPGEFGLLCPDPDTYGNCGAKAINDALGNEPSGVCKEVVEVETAPGTKLNQVVNGINERFGLYGNPQPNPKAKPAKDIIGHAKDPDVVAALNAGTDVPYLGNGNWAFDTYWTTYHASDAISLFDPNIDLSPTAKGTWPSRYQVWLFENGKSFYRKGKKTISPVPDSAAALPGGSGGWYLVNPPASDYFPEFPAGTEYATIADSNDPVPTRSWERRVLAVPVLNCVALGVKGSDTYPTFGQFVQMYVTECACGGGGCTNGKNDGSLEVCEAGPTSNGDIWAEVIGPLRQQAGLAAGAPQAVVENVRLVD
jgi:Flp pilus assembly protein TadG